MMVITLYDGENNHTYYNVITMTAKKWVQYRKKERKEGGGGGGSTAIHKGSWQ